jgi:hypothetical protein
MQTLTIPAAATRTEDVRLTGRQIADMFRAGNQRGDGFNPTDVPGCCAQPLYERQTDTECSVYLDYAGRLVLVADVNGEWAVAVSDEQLERVALDYVPGDEE